jgi:hypothetical protein
VTCGPTGWACCAAGTGNRRAAGAKVGLAGLHDPRPGHWDEMISRVRRAAEVGAAAPGCLVACRVPEVCHSR